MKHSKFLCRVYRPAGAQDCTGNGISARYEHLWVISDVPYTMTTFDGKTYYDRPDEAAVEEYCRKKGLNVMHSLCERAAIRPCLVAVSGKVTVRRAGGLPSNPSIRI